MGKLISVLFWMSRVMFFDMQVAPCVVPIDVWYLHFVTFEFPNDMHVVLLPMLIQDLRRNPQSRS